MCVCVCMCMWEAYVLMSMSLSWVWFANPFLWWTNEHNTQAGMKGTKYSIYTAGLLDSNSLWYLFFPTEVFCLSRAVWIFIWYCMEEMSCLQQTWVNGGYLTPCKTRITYSCLNMDLLNYVMNSRLVNAFSLDAFPWSDWNCLFSPLQKSLRFLTYCR